MGAMKKHLNVSSRADSADWRTAKVQKNLAGFIFVCSSYTIPDLERRIFGLPVGYADSVRNIRRGMPLFLFNYTNRRLYGVFEAASDGGFNIDPYAWENTDYVSKGGRPVSKYPAQVRVNIREERPALDEETFRPVLEHVDKLKFKLELTSQQVEQLLWLFGSSDQDLAVGRNGHNGYLPARDPDSPRSLYKSDSEYYSDSSSRGINSGEDEWTDEIPVDKGNYQHEEEEVIVGERLGHVALNESPSYGSEHFEMEDQLSAGHYNGGDVTWKESCQGAEYDSRIVLRLHDSDPAVNSNSMQTELDRSLTGNSQDNVVAMPMLSSPMQFPFTSSEHMILIPVQTVQCQQSESKWNDQRNISRGLLSSSQKQSSSADRIHRSKDARLKKQVHKDSQQAGNVQSQKMQINQVLVPFCTQGPGQVGDLATVLSPVFMPANGSVAYAQLQTGVRLDEPGQSFEDVQILPERLQQLLQRQLLQNGQGPILLMPSIIPRPPPPVRPAPITTKLVEALHFEVLEFARWTRPSSEIQLHVEAAIDCVRKGVKAVWPEADVEVFGSFATGLCLQHSDVDLAVVGAPRLPCSENLSIPQASASLIRELAAGLRTYEWCESINPLDTASMPVLKCLCRPFGTSSSSIPAIAVDVTIGTTRSLEASDQLPRPEKSSSRHTGGAAREYVLQKIRELPALAPLVLLLKSFLHHKGLSNVYMGGLGSFSLTLLVAFFLERVPSIEGRVDETVSDLPTSPSSSPLSCSSEHSDDSDTFSSRSSFGASSSNSTSECSGHSLGEFYVRRAANAIERVLAFWDQTGSPHLGVLLLGFLQTFGCERDLSREKIVLKGSDGNPGGFEKRDDRHVALWIDDPLRPGINIGAGSYGMVHVQNAFKEMLNVFLCSLQGLFPPLQCDDKDCQDLVAMGQVPFLRRLIVEVEGIQ